MSVPWKPSPRLLPVLFYAYGCSRGRVAERLEGLRDGYVRLRLTAAPVDGAANMACIAFLARTLGVNRAQVRLQAGVKSRDKLVHITGLTPAQVAAALGLVSS